jgi:tetratricopeptide (TPR) repeat protein
MFYLSDFDKKKIEGLVYLNDSDGETANEQGVIDCFKEALNIKDDPSLYSYISLALCRMREYKEAQDYAIKAIEKGYDAYGLYSKITVGNLANVNQAVKVLKSGVEKRNPSACLEMAKLHIDNNLEPDMVDYFEASKYLDLAFEYSSVEKRGLIAYTISRWYGILNRMHPYFKSTKKEDMELYYLKIFNEYGGAFVSSEGTNIELFNVYDANDDYGIIDVLYKRFDGDAYAIFALLLLQEEYEKTGTLNLDHNKGCLTAVAGAMRTGNGACRAISSICFASDFEGAVWDPSEANKILKDARRSGIYIPKRFESFYKELISHLDEEVRTGVATAKA